MVEASVLHPFETNPDDASTLEVVVEEFRDDGGETIMDGASQLHGDADFPPYTSLQEDPIAKPSTL